MGRSYFLILSLFLLSSLNNLMAQEANDSGEEDFSEELIEELAYEVLNTADESQREMDNAQLKATLRAVLQKDGAFSYPFSAVESLMILMSPDSMMRIFNWNIPHNDGSFSYACMILKAKEDGSKQLIELKPINTDSIELETFSGDKNHWPAALYYELIQKEAFNKTYYTLLAWDGHNRLTNRKWIEVFWFDQNGALKIGAPIFKKKDAPGLRRVVFRYASTNKMGLQYQEKLKRIAFDHLAPPRSSLEGVYEYYGVDFSHDAYNWEGNYWSYESSINIEEGLKKRKKDFQVDEDVIQEQVPIYQRD